MVQPQGTDAQLGQTPSAAGDVVPTAWMGHCIYICKCGKIRLDWIRLHRYT